MKKILLAIDEDLYECIKNNAKAMKQPITKEIREQLWSTMEARRNYIKKVTRTRYLITIDQENDNEKMDKEQEHFNTIIEDTVEAAKSLWGN